MEKIKTKINYLKMIMGSATILLQIMGSATILLQNIVLRNAY